LTFERPRSALILAALRFCAVRLQYDGTHETHKDPSRSLRAPFRSVPCQRAVPIPLWTSIRSFVPECTFDADHVPVRCVRRRIPSQPMAPALLTDGPKTTTDLTRHTRC